MSLKFLALIGCIFLAFSVISFGANNLCEMSDEELADQQFIIPLVQGNTITLRQGILYSLNSEKLSYAMVQKIRNFALIEKYVNLQIELGYGTKEKAVTCITYDLNWLVNWAIPNGIGSYMDICLGYWGAWDFENNCFDNGIGITFIKVDLNKVLHNLGITK